LNSKKALGNLSRVSDRIDFFKKELENKNWKKVTREWGIRLAPGLAGAATYG
jgi:hypothetical protein